MLCELLCHIKTSISIYKNIHIHKVCLNDHQNEITRNN